MANLEGNVKGNLVHVLIIPFPAAGHVIPLVELTRRLLSHRDSHLSITFVTTPSSLPLLQPLLSSFPPLLLEPLVLSPPSPTSLSDDALLPPTSLSDDAELPPTSFSDDALLPPYPTAGIHALEALSDPIISWCVSHPSPPQLIISDFFCAWSHKVSEHLCVPRLVFYPSGAFASAVLYSLWRVAPNNPGDDPNLEVVFDDVDGSPRFKWSELSFLFRSGEPGHPDWDVFRADLIGNLASWGAVFNTFSELEQVHVDYFKKVMSHNRVWAVGPLLQDDVAESCGPKCLEVMTWLDGKADCSVVYICFGSRTSLTLSESTVLRAALEYSKVHFVWCVRESDGEEGMDIQTSDFECDTNTFKNGLIIKGWSPQLAILGHRAVGGFVTHCGWNSIIESICTGVVTVAWPMGADQYSNAQLIVDQLGLGFKVMCDGPTGVPDPQTLGRLLVKCLSPTQSERDRVMRLREVAAATIKNGTSAFDFNQLIKHLSDSGDN